MLSAPKSQGDDAEFDGVDFESRFQNMFAEQDNGLLRAKTRRLRDRAGAQAQKEEIDNEKETENSDEAVDFLSQQLFEVFDVVMDPKRVELKEFLEKDEQYDWKFVNPMIKKQVRSVSFDMA